MTSAAPSLPKHGAPRLGRAFKATIALLLLIGLGWVGFIAIQYLNTGKPLAEISAVPKPLGKLVQEQPQFATSVWNVARPLGVAVASDGSIYVTESGGQRMLRAFDANGQPKGSISLTSGAGVPNPAYVAVAPDGRIYATDLNAGTLSIFSSEGQSLGQVPSPFGGPWAPAAVAFDSSGNLYVTDFTSGQHRVVVLDASGKLLTQFGSEGSDDGQFSFPNGIAVDAKGNIYVSDSGNGRVLAYDRNWNLLFKIGRGSGAADEAMPRGLAIDEGRHLLFVVDTTDARVNAYDISGAKPKFDYALGEAGPESALNFPNSVALDRKGHIYVADRENGRIAVWRY